MTTTDTQVQELVINTLTKQEYESIQNPSDTEIYMVTDDLLANFIGADGTNAGVAGLVPPPQATDNTKFLKGNGSWSNIALSSSDITNALGYIPQNSSTAVTHTNSTQVGNGTKPIYISSTGAATASSSTVGGSSTPVYLNAGTITSTGLSIASSRFDGQWVYSFSEIDTSTSVGDHVISLSSYLPNDSYKYEVLINVGVYGSDSNNAIVYMSSDILAIPYSDSYAKKIAHCNTNSRAACNRFTMPVGTGRTLTKTIKNKAPTYCSVGLLGYKRLGTNS